MASSKQNAFVLRWLSLQCTHQICVTTCENIPHINEVEADAVFLWVKWANVLLLDVLSFHVAFIYCLLKSVDVIFKRRQVILLIWEWKQPKLRCNSSLCNQQRICLNRLVNLDSLHCWSLDSLCVCCLLFTQTSCPLMAAELLVNLLHFHQYRCIVVIFMAIFKAKPICKNTLLLLCRTHCWTQKLCIVNWTDAVSINWYSCEY